MTPGRDLVQFDKKRREARTKGQIDHICNLLFYSVLHRLFTKEDNSTTDYSKNRSDHHLPLIPRLNSNFYASH